MYLYYGILLLALLNQTLSHGGFTAETPVLTAKGFLPIISLTENDTIISFNGSTVKAQRITHKNTQIHDQLIALYIEQSTIPLICAPEQSYYNPTSHTWIQAQELCVGDTLFTVDGTIVRITKLCILENTDTVHEITVDIDHTFFASEHAVLVHNPIPVAVSITFAFGNGAIEFMGLSISICAFGAWLSGKLFGKSNKQEKQLGSIGDCTIGYDISASLEGPLGDKYPTFIDTVAEKFPGSYCPIDDLPEKNIHMAKQGEKKKPKEKESNTKKQHPDKKQEEEKKEKRNATNQPDSKKEDRDKKIKDRRRPTIEEADVQAKELGYIKKIPPFETKTVAYKKGNSWISPDLNGHKGGYWKEFDRHGNRKHTWDKDMKKIIGD